MPSLCSDCGCDRNGHRHKNSRQKSNSHSKTSDGELVSPEKTPINTYTSSAGSSSKYEGSGKSGVGSDITRSGDSGRGSGKSSSSSGSKDEEKAAADEREEGEVEEKADDEIDEDELYLRLWALRSMIPAADLADVDKENKRVGDEDKVDDMMKLIQEADDAAETEVEIISVPEPEVEAEDHQVEGEASVGDEDDCDIERYRLDTTASFIQTSGPADTSLEEGKGRPVYLNSLVQKLRNSMQKFRQNERRQLDEQYSPSQSPLHEPFSPINSDSAAPSPTESGAEFEEISSNEDNSSSKGMDVVASSPFSSLPDHDPRNDDTVVTLTSSPMDDMTTDVERGCNLDSVPMEITSENEVEIGEIEFFRNQRALNEELFPTSVWGFKEVAEGSRSEAYWEAVTTGERARNSKTSRGAGRSRKRRRRKRSARTRDEATPAGTTSAKKARRDDPEVVLIEDESDDEDALRANLLLGMRKKRSETSSKHVAGDSSSSAAASPAPPPKPASPVPATTSSGSPLPPPASNEPTTSKPSVSRSVPTSSTSVIKKTPGVNPSATLPPCMPNKRPSVAISTKKPPMSVLEFKVQRTRVPAPPANTKYVDKRTKKRDPMRTTAGAKRLELSQILKKKYFPNLFTKIVIPMERPTGALVLPGSIEELLKEGRRHAERMEKKRSKKRTPPPKPLRKFPPHSKFSLKTPKVTFNTASLFSAAQKKSIIEFSDIQHLPLDQQQEYRRLQQIIKMKESTKKKMSRESANKENKVESEEEMRKRLIQGMVDKRKSKEVEVVNQSDNSRGTMAIVEDSSENSSRSSSRVVVSSTKEVPAKTEGPSVNGREIETAKKGLRSKTLVRKKTVLDPSKKLPPAPAQVKKPSPAPMKKPPPTTVEKPSPAPVKKSSNTAGLVKTTHERAVVADSKSNHEVRKKKGPSATKMAKPTVGDERRSQLDLKVRGSLQALESSVVGKRKELTSVLFKMSAQISTLKGERDQMQKAQDLVADLRKKLAETMELVARKEDRIADLNRVVRESHGQVNEQRGVVRLCEAECAAKGRDILGSDYRLPMDHSATIAKKLESIRSNAELLQSSPARSISAASSIIPPPPPVISKTSTSSSALAHLKSSNHHLQVDPHVEFCRYELQGKCNDDSCPFQHHTKRA